MSYKRHAISCNIWHNNSTYCSCGADKQFDNYFNTDCPHCVAPHGHYSTCPLLNRGVAEQRSREFNPTAADIAFANSIGIRLETNEAECAELKSKLDAALEAL